MAANNKYNGSSKADGVGFVWLENNRLLLFLRASSVVSGGAGDGKSIQLSGFGLNKNRKSKAIECL